MNPGLLDVNNNDPENFIDKPEYFHQYCWWILSEHEGTNIQTSITHIVNEQLYEGSNPHMFADINMIT